MQFGHKAAFLLLHENLGRAQPLIVLGLNLPRVTTSDQLSACLTSKHILRACVLCASERACVVHARTLLADSTGSHQMLVKVEPSLKCLQRVKNIRQDEIQQRPQLDKIVLQRRPS